MNQDALKLNNWAVTITTTKSSTKRSLMISSPPAFQRLRRESYRSSRDTSRRHWCWLKTKPSSLYDSRFRFHWQHSQVSSMIGNVRGRVARCWLEATLTGPPRILILTLTFDRKKNGTKTSLDVSTTLYEAGVNKKQLEDQRLDGKLLGLGKGILDNWTLDFIVWVSSGDPANS